MITLNRTESGVQLLAKGKERLTFTIKAKISNVNRSHQSRQSVKFYHLSRWLDGLQEIPLCTRNDSFYMVVTSSRG